MQSNLYHNIFYKIPVSGEPIHPELIPESDITRIQLLTEIFLDRDLPYYNIQIPPEAFLNKKLIQSKPDLLILTDRSLYLFECKVFTSCSEYALHDQIMKQKYVLDIIESVADHKYETKIHFLVLPYKYDVEDCFVITWKEIFDIFINDFPKDDYFVVRLSSMIKRF